MSLHTHVFKFCPRCGSAGFLPVGIKSYKCTNCYFHYYINSAAAVVGLIFNDLEEVLLTIRGVAPNKGSLDLPGGFVDPGESAEEALRREILEELNLEISQASFLISFPNEYLFSGLIVYTTDIAFVCKVNDLRNICVADDVAGYRFMPIDKIDLSEIFSSSIRNIILHYQSLKNDAVIL